MNATGRHEAPRLAGEEGKVEANESMGSGGYLVRNCAAQALDLPQVLKHDSRGHAAPLPVIDPLLESGRLVDANEARKRGVAACGFDNLGGFVRVHGDITHHV